MPKITWWLGRIKKAALGICSDNKRQRVKRHFHKFSFSLLLAIKNPFDAYQLMGLSFLCWVLCSHSYTLTAQCTTNPFLLKPTKQPLFHIRANSCHNTTSLYYTRHQKVFYYVFTLHYGDQCKIFLTRGLFEIPRTTRDLFGFGKNRVRICFIVNAHFLPHAMNVRPKPPGQNEINSRDTQVPFKVWDDYSSRYWRVVE